MRGGGSKAIWNFSKSSSNLVAGSFPKQYCVFMKFHKISDFDVKQVERAKEFLESER